MGRFTNLKFISKVLNEATAIDAKADSGESILPLCGLPLAVKDSVDVVGYPTTASTPALQGFSLLLHLYFQQGCTKRKTRKTKTVRV